jgi:hypothetical protein
LAPLAGRITHTGTVTFNNEVTVGDFEIGFDGDRIDQSTGATGFFVKDTFSLDAILFDIAEPATVDLDDPELTVGPADLLVSPEFADVLLNPDLAGADAGDAQINANVKEIVAPFVKVQGLGRYWRSTTVNGERSLAVPLDEVSNLRVDVGGGSDSVRLHRLTLPGSISIDLGSGWYNSASLYKVDAADVSINGGGGRDYVYLTHTSTDSLVIDTQGGRDSVSLWRTEVDEQTNINLGRGKDRLKLYRSTLEGETTLDGGRGRYDWLFARYSDFEGDLLNFRWKWIR